MKYMLQETLARDLLTPLALEIFVHVRAVQARAVHLPHYLASTRLEKLKAQGQQLPRTPCTDTCMPAFGPARQCWVARISTQIPLHMYSCNSLSFDGHLLCTPLAGADTMRCITGSTSPAAPALGTCKTRSLQPPGGGRWGRQAAHLCSCLTSLHLASRNGCMPLNSASAQATRHG